jgi:hypothetical protein
MNYQDGKIYRIDCLITKEVYIGSTIQSLTKRMKDHRHHFKRWKEGKGHYTSSYQIIERNSYKSSLIELYPCNSKDELYERERYFIKLIPCINKMVPNRTIEEEKEYQKKYREGHKEERKKQMKEWYDKNKEQYNSKRREQYNEKKNESII